MKRLIRRINHIGNERINYAIILKNENSGEVNIIRSNDLKVEEDIEMDNKEIEKENIRREKLFSNIDEIAVSYTEILKKRINEVKEKSELPLENSMNEINENIRILNHITGIIHKMEMLKGSNKKPFNINNYYTNYGD